MTAPLLAVALWALGGPGGAASAHEPADASESLEADDGEQTDALVEADQEAASIAARLRRARAGRARASYWPRLAVTVSLDGRLDRSLDRQAGEAWRLGAARPRGLVWSILAIWGAP